MRIIKDKRVRIRVNQTRYSEGNTVDTPDGIGVITGILTETAETDDDTIEASESSPTYIVLLEDEDMMFGTYKASELNEEDIETDVEPMESLEEVAGNTDVTMMDVLAAQLSGNQDGFFEWPESWTDSDTPARVIALKALAGMNGSFDGCVREMRGNVTRPQAFCADFLDRLYGSPYWRGDSPLPGD